MFHSRGFDRTTRTTPGSAPAIILKLVSLPSFAIVDNKPASGDLSKTQCDKRPVQCTSLPGHVPLQILLLLLILLVNHSSQKFVKFNYIYMYIYSIYKCHDTLRKFINFINLFLNGLQDIFGWNEEKDRDAPSLHISLFLARKY